MVLWEPGQVPPPGPLLDAAALATTEWDWSYVGPPTPIRPSTMAVVRDLEELTSPGVLDVDIVVGAPTRWTLERVVELGARFVAIALGESSTSARSDSVELDDDVVVEGWPSASQWPAVLDAAVDLDETHHQGIADSVGAGDVADELRTLLRQIRERHLPSAFRSPD